MKRVGYNGRRCVGRFPQLYATKVAEKDWTFTVTGIGAGAMMQYETSSSSSNYWFTSVSFPKSLAYIAKDGCQWPRAG